MFPKIEFNPRPCNYPRRVRRSEYLFNLHPSPKGSCFSLIASEVFPHISPEAVVQSKENWLQVNHTNLECLKKHEDIFYSIIFLRQ